MKRILSTMEKSESSRKDRRQLRAIVVLTWISLGTLIRQTLRSSECSWSTFSKILATLTKTFSLIIRRVMNRIPSTHSSTYLISSSNSIFSNNRYSSNSSSRGIRQLPLASNLKLHQAMQIIQISSSSHHSNNQERPISNNLKPSQVNDQMQPWAPSRPIIMPLNARLRSKPNPNRKRQLQLLVTSNNSKL